MLEYAERVPFANHSGKGRMYYNLYLYFHQAQKNTSFFPELFKALREDPLKTYNPDCLNGTHSVLKFVRKACEIAEEDLSDYFRVWGFLDPLSKEEVEGGQLTVTKAAINNTLKKIAVYPKNRTLLFIEDRVKPLYTTAPFNTPGKLRDGYSNMAQYGNLGQFTDYLPGACESANYTYMKYGSLYQMTGSGGVGFLMLDEDNNFVYASNSLNFYIPSSITTEFTIYSVDADGTLSEVPQADGGTNETLFYIRNVRDSEYYVTTTKGLNGGAQQLGSAKSFTDDKTKVLFKLLENGKIVSVNTSSELYLRYKDSNAGEGGSCVELSKTDDQNIWTLEARTNGENGEYAGFAIIAGTSENSLNMYGKAGNDMGLFRKTDAGSVWEFVSVTKTEYLNGLISDAKAFYTTADANKGDKIGEYSPTALEALSTAIATAEAIEGDVTTEHVVALKNAMDAVKVILPTAGKYYQIHSSLAAFSETKAVYSGEEDRARWKSLNNDDKSFYWKAVATPDDAIVLQNAQDGKYMEGRSSQGSGWKMVDSYSDASKLSIKIHNKENKNGYEYGLIMNNWQMHAEEHGNGNGSEGKIISYNDGANSASAWFIREVELPKEFCTVTYSFVYNVNDEEKVYSTTTFEVSKGATYPEVVVPALPYGVSVKNATTPEGNVTESKEYKFTLELTTPLPFEAAADVNSIQKWYHLKFAGDYYLYYSDDDVVLDANKTSVDANAKEAYSWAFVGNPFEGFKVYNQQAEKYLNAAEAGAVVGASAQDFFLTESPYGTNGFYMQAKDGDYQQYRFNRQDNEVKYWISADAGSTFMVELRDDSQALNDLVAKAEEFISSQDQGTTVGYITEDSKTAISNNIANAKTAIENKSGYLAAQASLQEALDEVVTIQPEEGKFYYIASAMPGDGYCSGKKMYVNATGGMKFETAENKMGNIFQFVAARNEGEFYLYNVERDAYLNTNNGHNGGQVTVGVDSEAKPVTITNMGKENVVKIVPVGGAMLHAREIESQIIAFDIDNVDGASAWKIVEVEAESLNEFAYNLNIDEYKTLFLNYNVVIPEGVTAYAVTGVAETNVLQMTELAGVVPAKTAVVVYAENSGDYAFKYTTTAGAAPEGNLLQGSVKNTYVEGAAYVLANGNKGVGLYKAALNKDADGATGTTHFLNNAGKAYLPASAVTSNAAMFSFGRGEGTTSIEDVELINENVVIYDLTGRRVEKMEKGIYIVNGKKVLVM